jgi:uncharacterized protein YfaS (alpha-2-macroglobulin family)
VTTDQPSYVRSPELVEGRGDVITATVSASYDFEMPVAGAGVSYTLYAANYLPPPPGDDFDFGDVGQEGADDDRRPVVSGQGVTDDTGRFIIVLPTEIESSPGSRLFALKATVTAPGQQPVSASTFFPIHQSSFYIGLRPERRVARVGQEVTFEVQTVAAEGLVLSTEPSRVAPQKG